MLSESTLNKSSVLSLELSPSVKENITRNDVQKFSTELLREAKKGEVVVMVFPKKKLN